MLSVGWYRGFLGSIRLNAWKICGSSSFTTLSYWPCDGTGPQHGDSVCGRRLMDRNVPPIHRRGIRLCVWGALSSAGGTPAAARSSFLRAPRCPVTTMAAAVSVTRRNKPKKISPLACSFGGANSRGIAQSLGRRFRRHLRSRACPERWPDLDG